LHHYHTCSTPPPQCPVHCFLTHSHPLSHTLFSPLSHICSLPVLTIRILSDPHKSTSRHQDMELSISKLPTPSSFNPRISAQLCLLGFPTVSEAGALPLCAHQGASPATPCSALCFSPELSLDVHPQENTHSPSLKQLTKLILYYPGPCSSLEFCWGVPPQCLPLIQSFL